jgi:hypothetical protein
MRHEDQSLTCITRPTWGRVLWSTFKIISTAAHTHLLRNRITLCMREGCRLWASANDRVHSMLKDYMLQNQPRLFSSIYDTRVSRLTRIWVRRSRKLITQFYRAGRSRVCGGIPPLPYTYSWHIKPWSQGHSGWIIKTPFLFTFTTVSNDGLLTRIYS